MMNTGSPRPAEAGRQATAKAHTPFGRATVLAIAATLAIVVVLATFQGSPSLQAAVTTLISNTGKTTATTVVTLGTGMSDDSRAAQSFFTGTNTDGYTVSSIGMKLATLSDATNAGTDLKLEIYSDASSSPDSAICTLSDPATFTAGAVNEFTAPTGAEPCPRLLSGTVYHAVLERVATTTANSTVTVSTTSDNTEDTGGATGWSIGNNARKYASSWSAIPNNSLQVQIKGESVTKVAATGQPVIRASAEGAPYLFAETTDIRDEDGLPFTHATAEDMTIGAGAGGPVKFFYSYQWIRVDGETETNIGTDSPVYHLVDADYGKLIKVEVSFTDQGSSSEMVTSDPFRPVRRAADSLLTSATLVSNTGQTPSADASITKQYAQGFTLGGHGQGYELSSVSIDLAAAPTDLTVSLWIADHGVKSEDLESRLYDFKNPPMLAVGTNKFTAPPGVLVYQNVQYAIVLSGFGTSLSIKETTSDAEDSGGETGAVLADTARERDLGESGRWGSSTTRASVLLLAIEGSKRSSGILASTYGQTASSDQEIISVGDRCCIRVDVGAADRYLIRGFSWNADDSTVLGGGVTNPWDLRDGSDTGDKLFRLFITRNIAGVPEWSAPQGATVAGGTDKSYAFSTDWDAYDHIGDGSRTGHTQTRVHGTQSTDFDMPMAPGVTFSETGDVNIPQLLAAVLGEPLYAMVQNLGQDNSGHVSVGGTNKVVTQGFTTGSQAGGYGLLGIGVNIEGSDDSNSVAQIPDDATSVSVSVYDHGGGDLPREKLFDLVSPAEYAPGHSFFEAPAGTRLNPNTTYVLVWSHVSGTNHRLQKTSSNDVDSGADAGSDITGVFHRGANVDNLTSNSNSLEIAVYTDTPPRNATGRPLVYPSAEGAGLLLADTEGIDDPDGLRFTDPGDSSRFGYDDWSYQWIRVDGGTETEVGADLARYQRVDADIGKLIRVRVSYTDRKGIAESVTSLPFGPVPGRAPSQPASTLVGNTQQSPSAAANITQQYALGFHLGAHGQGYELSAVSIDLVAAPSSLTVSLWSGGQAGSEAGATAAVASKVFDFENPDSLVEGLNKFTAPASAFAYQNVRYWIVLSDFGDSLSINETTSDAEDEGGETGAALGNKASVRAASATGNWNTSLTRNSVLRLAVEGSRRASGFLASTYAQTGGQQEIISLGDEVGIPVNLGTADRYLIRGFSWFADTTNTSGGKSSTSQPFDLRSGFTTGSPNDEGQEIITSPGDRLFGLAPTRYGAGINVWTAPQGATVAGSGSYLFYNKLTWRPHGTTLTRVHNTPVTAGEDRPTAPGVSLPRGVGSFAGKPLMAFIGEPLYALVQNLGQTDNSYVQLGGLDGKDVLSQGFTTGSQAGGYGLRGIGVNIEGSTSSNGVAQLPDDATSVTVSVHADSSGKPGMKLFDLVSPTEYAAGHSFFEAPAGTTLAASTAYVLVWTHKAGTVHRLQRTTSNTEDSGAFGGATIADAFYLGADLADLTVNSGGNSLEIAVYTDTTPLNATGQPVIRASAEGAPYLFAETTDIRDEDGLPFTHATAEDMTIGAGAGGPVKFFYSYQWIRVDGETETNIGTDSPVYHLVDADYGKLIKVEVSFTDQGSSSEMVTSDPFRPVRRAADSLLTSATLVSNTGQTPSADASITKQYAQGFTLGGHGQGYELSSVSIDLAAAPTDLTVSLWIADHGVKSEDLESRLYDFKNPPMLAVGTNKFTAPPGVLVYQNVQYAIVLSGFGTSLSIKETTSDAEDSGGETGAVLADTARERDLGESGRWGSSTTRASVLLLAIEGSKRSSGILASTYGQTASSDQEIISVGDRCCIRVDVGAADRYLIRGFSWNADDSTVLGGGVTNPWDLRDGSDTGDKLFRLFITRNIAGVPEWSAPQGATVAGGGKTYVFD